MIDAYSQEIEANLSSSPIIVSHSLRLARLSPSTAYLEGSAVFTNGSQLFFFEFLRLGKGEVKREKYRYHYATDNNKLIFRYDNAPHYQKVKTFPHHKHLGKGTIESKGPKLKETIGEIEEIVLNLPSI